MDGMDDFRRLRGETQAVDPARAADARVEAMRRRRTRSGTLAATCVAAVALVLSAGLSWPVLADTWLGRMLVIETRTPTGANEPAPYDPGEAAEGRSGAEVAREVGFTPLVPARAPFGCSLKEYRVDADVAEIRMAYECGTGGGDVLITQRAGGDGEPVPYGVGPGSSEKLTVGGVPAVYVRGAWVEVWGETIWQENFGQELVLERDGVLVRIEGGGAEPGKIQLADGTYAENSVTPKSDLLRMAESLQLQE